MSPLEHLATWEPMMRAARAALLDATGSGGHPEARIGRNSWGQRRTARGAVQVAASPGGADAVARVRGVLAEVGADSVTFAIEVDPSDTTVLHVLGACPAVESDAGAWVGALLLVEGAVPEPWRRLPEPVPGVAAAQSADPVLVQRTVRERLPDAVGATEEEIAATEARLGIALPDELTALYRVTRGRGEDRGEDYAAWIRAVQVLRCEMFPLDELHLADAASRPTPWTHAARQSVTAAPATAVQAQVGSPGWIALGQDEGDGRFAVDLTPGPRGHVGQIIYLSREETDVFLLADSLTDFLLGRRPQLHHTRHHDQPRPLRTSAVGARRASRPPLTPGSRCCASWRRSSR